MSEHHRAGEHRLWHRRHDLRILCHPGATSAGQAAGRRAAPECAILDLRRLVLSVESSGAGGIRTHDLTDLRSVALPKARGRGGDVSSLVTAQAGLCGVES